MKINETRAYIKLMRDHIDQVNFFTRQVMNMIYEIEEKLFDVEDGICEFKDNIFDDTIGFLENAASRIYTLNDSPARLSIRCSKDISAASGLYQSEFNLKKIV